MSYGNEILPASFCYIFFSFIFCFFFALFVVVFQNLRILRGADLCIRRKFTELILIVAISTKNYATECVARQLLSWHMCNELVYFHYQLTRKSVELSEGPPKLPPTPLSTKNMQKIIQILFIHIYFVWNFNLYFVLGKRSNYDNDMVYFEGGPKYREHCHAHKWI